MNFLSGDDQPKYIRNCRNKIIRKFNFRQIISRAINIKDYVLDENKLYKIFTERFVRVINEIKK